MERGSKLFREGDKVMQIKNNYDIIWTKGKEVSSGIFNGDIGILEKIDRKNSYLKVRFDDKVAVYYSDNIGELELAYAITIHQSQRSEYPAVVLPLLTGPTMLMNRNLLYTAVTRAKACVTIVGTQTAVTEMINNMNENKRYSGLKRLITNAMEGI